MPAVKYRDKPALQDRLAAEYVLGTLRGPARARFQSWLRDDAALRRTVSEWEERLAPMASAVREVAPPARVWQNIEARIGKPAGVPAGAARPVASAAAPASGWWDSLAFWRNWGLVATGCAAALMVATALRAPEIVEREVVRTVEVPSNAMQPSYIAMLEDDRGELVFMAYAGRKSDELWVKRMGMKPLEPGQSYELWALPGKPGMPVTSLGVIPAGEKGTIKLASIADQRLADVPQLAISLEPEGGSKTGQPTGPVMYKGDCLRFW
jgi:anti-sigma-K factor RskA